jgi:hypothetical protein
VDGVEAGVFTLVVAAAGCETVVVVEVAVGKLLRLCSGLISRKIKKYAPLAVTAKMTTAPTIFGVVEL